MKIDDINPIERKTLIEIHETNRVAIRNPTVHLLLMEIARLRQVVRDINSNYDSMRTVWREEIGGETVGMYNMRIILHREMRVYGPAVDIRNDTAKERLLQHSDNRRFLEKIKVLDNVRKNKSKP